jgi:TBC1 domain family member 5
MDERTPDERPPWEPKSRREMEQEIDSTKVIHRRLGESVAWIVDALLQSEDTEDADKEKIEKIKKRKQGALESLAYVRDVLQGNVTTLEDDRLWDEEELGKRKTQAQAPAAPPVPNVPPVQPAVVAPAATSSNIPALSGPPPTESGSSTSSSRFTARSSATPFMPRFSPPAPLPLSPPPPSKPQTPSVLSPDATPLAPWKYTKSDFSAPSPVVLPPQPASAKISRTPSPTVSKKVSSPSVPHTVLASTQGVPSTNRPSVDGGSGTKRGRQEVEHDPLGALR